MPPRRATANLVYSTELGRTCPACRQSLTACQCGRNNTRLLGDGNVRVGRETRGRGGKTVTLITGLPLVASELSALTTQLKKRCGTGGTLKDGVIEIQGDHRDTIMDQLQSLGHKPKRGGG